MHRHIIERYPTPPPVRARRPPWSISAGRVIKLERVAQQLGHVAGWVAPRVTGCAKKQHIPRRAPLKAEQLKSEVALSLVVELF